jgi:hypothetical protein
VVSVKTSTVHGAELVAFCWMGVCPSAVAASSCAVTSYGAFSDATHAASTTEAFRRAFSDCSNGQVYVARGTYLIDNNGGPHIVQGFRGELIFDNAKLLFTNNRNGGLYFIRGAGARVRNLRIGYQTPPVVRNSPQEGIVFDSVIDVDVENVVVENAPGAGLLFTGCVRPRVTNVTILSSKADGVHFANCQEARLTNVETHDTGDDGLAFVNYGAGPDYRGAIATHINIKNSKSRGISVVGQSDVTISDFSIDGTSSSGVYVAAEGEPYYTRVPNNVRFYDGVVNDAGTIAPLIGNQFGIEYSDVHSVEFSHIRVNSSGNRGLSGIAPFGNVKAKDIYVYANRRGEGIHVTAADVSLQNCAAEKTPSYGIIVKNSGTVAARHLSVLDTSQQNGLGRAIWFEGNTRVLVDGVNILDDQITPTGYLFGMFGNGAIVSIAGLQQTAGRQTNPGTFRAGPIIYGGRPGLRPLPNGTQSATMSVQTRVSATCKYADHPGRAYGVMTNFMSGSGTMMHEATVQSLQNGDVYNYYIRCANADGNVSMSDYVLTFSVSAAPPGM